MAVPWFDVLDRVKEIAKGKVPKKPETAIFSAEELADKSGLPENVASAWLGKFCMWGYVGRVGNAPSKGRYRTLYSMTIWGLNFVRKKKGPVGQRGSPQS